MLLTLRNCSTALLLALALPAQSDVLRIAPVAPVAGKRGEAVSIKLDLKLANGYHLNSHKPEDQYLIPLRLTWDAAVDTVDVKFPEPKHERYAFSDKALSVFTGDFSITSSVKPKNPGFTVLTGKLRYQACNHNACLPPKTIDVKVPADIR